ncbi:MAG: TlpA disulfide reductase family protein [Kineosporiaceae bacterium]
MSARRSAIPTVAGALAAALALAGCSGSGNGEQAGQSFVAGDGVITLLAPDKRPEPGALSGTTISGQTIDLSAEQGHAVVLNVWGSWCAPCQKEAPALEKASQQLAAKGVRFIGINTRENGNKDAAAAFQRAYGITYPSLFDAGSDALLALRGAVSANAIPTTVIVDPQGRIAARISGPTTTDTLVDLVDEVLTGRTGSP